ncbi:hypothetical protein HK100_006316, partial [Physocladia obscura]
MYDCVNLLAYGIQEAISSPISAPFSESVRRRLNFSAFSNTGYLGYTGNPMINLTKVGDVKVPYYFSYIDGLDETFHTIPFAYTDLDMLSIIPIAGSPPIFFDGSSTPPSDGSILYILDESFSVKSGSGRLIIALSTIGLVTCVAACYLIHRYGQIPEIKSASPVFLRYIICGCALSFLSMLVFLPQDVLNCHLQVWLQELAYTVTISSLILKNARVLNITRWISVNLAVIGFSVIILSFWSQFIGLEIVTATNGNTMGYSALAAIAVHATLWVFNGLLLISAIVISLLHRDSFTVYGESVLVLIFSVTLAAAVLVFETLILTTSNPTPSINRIHSLLIWAVTFSFMLSMFGTKALIVVSTNVAKHLATTKSIIANMTSKTNAEFTTSSPKKNSVVPAKKAAVKLDGKKLVSSRNGLASVCLQSWVLTKSKWTLSLITLYQLDDEKNLLLAMTATDTDQPLCACFNSRETLFCGAGGTCVELNSLAGKVLFDFGDEKEAKQFMRNFSEELTRNKKSA